MPSAKKPTLRTLAVEAGLYKQNDMKVFQMGIDELVDALKKDFPGIEEMDDAAVVQLLADVKKNGVKGGTGGGKDEEPARGGRGRGKTEEEPPARGRGRGRGEEPEPKKESEEPARGRGRGRGADREEPEPEPETRGRGRGRGGDEPDAQPADEPARGRGRGGRGRTEEPEEKPTETKGGPDNAQVMALLEEVLGQLGALSKRFDGLEKQGAGTTKTLEALQDKVTELYDGVECVVFGDSAKKGETTLAEVIKRVKG